MTTTYAEIAASKRWKISSNSWACVQRVLTGRCWRSLATRKCLCEHAPFVPDTGVMDHARIWRRSGTHRYAITLEPYQLPNSEHVLRFVNHCAAIGVNAVITHDSPHGADCMIIMTKATVDTDTGLG